jgi:hypothetical protein
MVETDSDGSSRRFQCGIHRSVWYHELWI